MKTWIIRLSACVVMCVSCALWAEEEPFPTEPIPVLLPLESSPYIDDLLNSSWHPEIAQNRPQSTSYLTGSIIKTESGLALCGEYRPENGEENETLIFEQYVLIGPVCFYCGEQLDEQRCCANPDCPIRQDP